MWSWSPPVFPNFLCNAPGFLLICQKRGKSFQDPRSEKAVLCDSSCKVEFFQIVYNTADFFITLEWIFVIAALPFPPMENVFQFLAPVLHPSLGVWRLKASGGCYFFTTYSIGSYHSWTVSPLHKTSGRKLIFLSICGILNMLFILYFVLFKCYFCASSLDSWMFFSVHSLPLFLKGFSM